MDSAIEMWRATFAQAIERIDELEPSSDWGKIPVAKALQCMSSEEIKELDIDSLPMHEIETAYDLRREWQARYESDCGQEID